MKQAVGHSGLKTVARILLVGHLVVLVKIRVRTISSYSWRCRCLLHFSEESVWYVPYMSQQEEE